MRGECSCHFATPTSHRNKYQNFSSAVLFISCLFCHFIFLFIIRLANFASFDWSVPGPITYGTDPDGSVTFAFFRCCFICTLFELVIFTNEMVNHFGFNKGSLGLEIRLFHDSKKKQKSKNNYTKPKTDYENCQQQQILNLSVQIFLFCFKIHKKSRTSSFVQKLLTGQQTKAKPFSNFYTKF